MPGIVFGLLLWCPAIVGWGILARRAGGQPVARDTLDLSDVPAGFLALAGLALALNFFVPLDRVVAGALCLAGWIGALAAFRRRAPGSLARAFALPLLIVCAVAFAASQPVHYGYDVALYHLQTMQWAEQGRVPFGLANLSGRYGYNSAWLLLATIVRDPFDARFLEHAILLPGTMLVFALLAVRRCWSLARNGVAGRLGLLGGLAIASPAVYATVNSTAQDLVPLIAWVVCAALFVRSVERADESASRVTELWQVATIAIVAKLSAVVLLLVPVAAMLRLPSLRAVPGRERVRLFARFVWLPALVLACWSARGLVLSGCAAYPAGATCVNALSWSVGSAAANAESRTITAWARQPFVEPARVPSFPGWVRPWLVRVIRDPDLLMPLALVVAGLIAAGAAGTATRSPPRIQLLVAVIGVAIAVWLATAPDPRFGAGPLWALGTLVAASAGMGSRDIARDIARGSRAWIALGLALLVWAPHAVGMLRLVTRPARNPGLTAVLRTPHIGIMRTPPMRAALTQAGDTIWVPASAREDQCFLAPLPCAPSLPAGLVVMRGRDGAMTEFRTRNPDP